MSSLLTTAELAADAAVCAEPAPRAAAGPAVERAALGLPPATYLALADQAVVSGTSFVLVWIVKRLCDDAGLGRYSLGMSILALATVVHSSLILSPYTFYVHQEAAERRRSLAGSVLGLQLAAMLAVVVLALPVVWIVSSAGTADTAALAWAMFFALPGVLLREFTRKLLLAEWRAGAVLLIDSAVAAGQLGLVGLSASRQSFGPAAAHAACGVAAALVSALWLVSARSRFEWRSRRMWSDWSRGFQMGKWVCADQGLMVVTAYLIHWVLVMLMGVEATGQFAVCLIVVQLANPLLFGMGNILEPQAAQAVARGGVAELRRYAAATTWRLGALFGALCLSFMLLGPAFIRRVFGADFPELSITVALLALQILAFALAVGYHLGLRAVQRSDLNVAIGVLGFVVTLAAAWAGVKSVGVAGGALALLAGNLTIWLARWLAFSLVTRKSGEALP